MMLGWSYFGQRYWGLAYWGGRLDSSEAGITDTDALPRPVNVVMAGDTPIKATGREFDIRPANFRTKAVVSRTPTRRLKGGKPSFTVRTGTKGYN